MLGGSGAGKGTFLRAGAFAAVRSNTAIHFNFVPLEEISTCHTLNSFVIDPKHWKEIEVMKKNGMDLDNFVVHGLDE